MSSYILAVTALVILVSASIIMTDTKHCLIAMVFLIPWVGVSYDAGLEIKAWMIFAAPLIFKIIFSPKVSSINIYSSSGVKFLCYYITYSCCLTIISIPFLPDTLVYGGWARQPIQRALFQIPSLLLTWAPLFIVLYLVRTREAVFQVARTILVSITFLSILGMLQLTIYLSTGIDPFPVGFINEVLGGGSSDVRYGGAYQIGATQITRINSFGGEPKSLGATLAVALIIVQIFIVNRYQVFRLQTLCAIWLTFAVTLFLTLSTLGFSLWAIGSAVHVLLSLFFESSREVLLKIKFYIYLCLILATIGLFFSLLGMPVIDAVFDRTIIRFSESGTVLEDFNIAVVDFLLHNPLISLWGVGMGNVHLYADSYLSADAQLYASGTAFVAKSAYLRIISEVGLIGFILFVFWILEVAKTRLINQSAHVSNLLKTFRIIVPVLFVIFLFGGGYVTSLFALLSGLSISFLRVKNYNN